MTPFFGIFVRGEYVIVRFVEATSPCFHRQMPKLP